MKLRTLKKKIIDKKYYILKSYSYIREPYLAEDLGINIKSWSLVRKVSIAKKFKSIEEAKIFLNENRNLKNFKIVCYEDEVKKIKERN